MILKRQINQDFDKKCYYIAGKSPFAKGVIIVLAMAVGFALGMIIGATVGILLGIWTGPGAVVTALAGLSSGAITGAAIGVVVMGATASAATGFFTVQKQVFFRPKPIEGARKKVLEELTSPKNFG